MDLTAWIEVSTRLALLIGVACAMVWIFRTIRLPGGRPACSLLAGSLSGLLCGPSLFGALAPPHYQRVIVGADAERQSLAALEDRHVAALEALGSTGVSSVAIEELADRQARERTDAERAIADAVDLRADAAAGVAIGLLTLLALAGNATRRRPPRAIALRGDETASLAAGAMGGLVAGLVTLALARWLLEMPVRSAAALAGAIVGGSVLFELPMRWSAEIGRARAARQMAMGLTLVAAGGLAFGTGIDGAGWWGAPIGAWIVGSMVGPVRVSARARRVLRGVALWLVIPLVAGELAVRLQLGALLHGPWPIILIVIGAAATGDGHGLGAWLGLKTYASGRARDLPMLLTLETLLRGSAATSVALGLGAVAAGALDAGAHPGAAGVALVLVSAIALEVQMDWARPVARAMDGGDG